MKRRNFREAAVSGETHKLCCFMEKEKAKRVLKDKAQPGDQSPLGEGDLRERRGVGEWLQALSWGCSLSYRRTF